MKAELMVRVVRGAVTESTHNGSVAVTDDEGKLLYALGDPYRLTYIRSTAKPLQAVPILESGAADRFSLTDREITLICASHNGEQGHIDTVQSLLSKIGLTESDLQCGVHPPFDKQAAELLAASGRKPTALHNNCSGKHSGMLALAKHLGADTSGYLSIDHPVQQMMLATVSGLSDTPEEDIAIGADGCGVPVFGMPLANLAAAYARLGTGKHMPPARAAACKRILAAIAAHPFEIAGTDRLDTDLISVTDGRIIGKFGAEGTFAVSMPSLGLGLAIKAEDGNPRALGPAVIAALHQIGVITHAEWERLQNHFRPRLKNWSGRDIGYLEADFTLDRKA